MKLGLDLHGVVDKDPKIFSLNTNALVTNGHEVHIITGEEDSEKLRNALEFLKIRYTHLFSISTHHKQSGTEMRYDENGNPWMDKEVWNTTKALYCEKIGIDLHIDDSEVYGRYFKTPYFLFTKNMGRVELLCDSPLASLLAKSQDGAGKMCTDPIWPFSFEWIKVFSGGFRRIFSRLFLYRGWPSRPKI